MTIKGQYASEVRLDDKFTLAFELDIEGDYVYEAPTMYDRNGDPGDPGCEEISIEGYMIDSYSLIDNNGEEVSDTSIYEAYEAIAEAKIREVYSSLDAAAIDWDDPEYDEPEPEDIDIYNADIKGELK